MKNELTRRDALKKIAAGGAAAAASVFWVDALVSAAEQHAAHYHAPAAAATGPWTPKVLSPIRTTPSSRWPRSSSRRPRRRAPRRRASTSSSTACSSTRRPTTARSSSTASRGSTAHMKETSRRPRSSKLAPERSLPLSRRSRRQPAGTPGGDFFRAIKSLTVTGYYTSEVAMREEIGDDGNMFFAEFKGCTHPEHSRARLSAAPFGRPQSAGPQSVVRSP